MHKSSLSPLSAMSSWSYILGVVVLCGIAITVESLCNLSCNQQLGWTIGVNDIESYYTSCKNPSIYEAKIKDFGSEIRECLERRGPFYMVRRRGNEYRCDKEVSYDNDYRIWYMYKTPWRKFYGYPSICEVCQASAFYKRIFIYRLENVSEKLAMKRPPPSMGCNRPANCKINEGYLERPCKSCVTYQDDGMCCKHCSGGGY